ncbi:flagellar filament capping protein FliD [Alkalicoccus chagannorensis]|uniref:flagellar filament capping protein FliD n=1 Tax=Alkalicoccus chagannorensis TaxID=427072 RepID=UPI0004147EFF|nr:flagellar filament capping protein FliD [Alkalicoccus chagannorensis]
MRLTGFATGLDINQMVQDLMKAERMPMERMEQDKIRAEVRMDQYREINEKLRDFRDNTFDSVLRRSQMLANEGTSSHENLVTAQASSSASQASLRITEVTSLASAASNASAGAVSEEPVDVQASFGSQAFAGEESGAWTRGLVNRQTITVQQAHTTMSLDEELGNPDSVVVRVNGQAYKVVEEFDEGLRATQVMINPDTNELTFGESLARNDRVEVTAMTADENGPDLYSVNELTVYDEDGQAVRDAFVVTSEDSMEDVISQFNRSVTGVNAFFDEQSRRVSVMREDTGVFAAEGQPEMQFSGTFFNDVLRLDDAGETAARNAAFTVNGLETHRRSNTFTISNIQLTLQDTFSDRDVTVGVSRNTDSIMETITSFIDEYNEIVELVNGRVREESFRDYPPLTEEQRRELSEREAELWDERAESGLLRNDGLLRNGMNTFRQQFYTPVMGDVDTSITQLTQIGISTTSNFRDGGILEVDEEKLRAAIETDAEGVFQLFAGDGTPQEQGIARRVRASADTLIESIAQRAGGSRGRTVNHQFTIGREINNIEDRMTNFERRLEQIENRYWAQFNAMEQAVQRANSQSESFFAQMYGNF